MLKIMTFFLFSISIAMAGPMELAHSLISKNAKIIDISARVDAFSKTFMQLPYSGNGPLGEGPTGHFDQDPLYRFDVFDCMTYVETVLALSVSQDLEQFETVINHIRYENGEVDFMKRNHFVDLQWIPNNIQLGILQEINEIIVPESQIITVETLVNFPEWIRKLSLETVQIPYAAQPDREALLEELHQLSSQVVPMMAKISYIEIEDILEHPHLLKRIPHGAVVNFIRPNWNLKYKIGTNMNVSHQGFLIRKGDVLYLRHASSDIKKIIEVPFDEYLRKFQDSPTLKGVHFMKVNSTYSTL